MKVSDLEGDCVVSRQCQSKRDPNRYGYKRFRIPVNNYQLKQQMRLR